MRRDYPRSPDEVIDRRLGYAAARNAHIPDTEIWQKMRCLPPGEMTVPDRFWGRRAVERYLREHGGDSEALRELIETLDVAGEEG